MTETFEMPKQAGKSKLTAQQAVRDAKQYIDICTGLRKAFIDKGWSSAGAEQMVAAMLQQVFHPMPTVPDA